MRRYYSYCHSLARIRQLPEFPARFILTSDYIYRGYPTEIVVLRLLGAVRVDVMMLWIALVLGFVPSLLGKKVLWSCTNM